MQSTQVSICILLVWNQECKSCLQLMSKLSHEEQTATLWKSSYDLIYSRTIHYTCCKQYDFCQLWVGWSNLYTTEIKSSVVHVLYLSHCKFYRRVCLKKMAVLGIPLLLQKTLAAESLLWEREGGGDSNLNNFQDLCEKLEYLWIYSGEQMYCHILPNLEPNPTVTILRGQQLITLAMVWPLNIDDFHIHL